MHRRRPGCKVSKYGRGVKAAWSADQRCKVSKYGRGVKAAWSADQRCKVSKYGRGVKAAWSADQRCKVSKYGRGVNKTSALVSQKPMFKNRHVKLPLLYDGFFFCRCKADYFLYWAS